MFPFWTFSITPDSFPPRSLNIPFLDLGSYLTFFLKPVLCALIVVAKNRSFFFFRKMKYSCLSLHSLHLKDLPQVLQLTRTWIDQLQHCQEKSQKITHEHIKIITTDQMSIEFSFSSKLSASLKLWRWVNLPISFLLKHFPVRGRQTDRRFCRDFNAPQSFKFYPFCLQYCLLIPKSAYLCWGEGLHS